MAASAAAETTVVAFDQEEPQLGTAVYDKDGNYVVALRGTRPARIVPALGVAVSQLVLATGLLILIVVPFSAARVPNCADTCLDTCDGPDGLLYMLKIHIMRFFYITVIAFVAARRLELRHGRLVAFVIGFALFRLVVQTGLGVALIAAPGSIRLVLEFLVDILLLLLLIYPLSGWSTAQTKRIAGPLIGLNVTGSLCTAVLFVLLPGLTANSETLRRLVLIVFPTLVTMSEFLMVRAMHWTSRTMPLDLLSQTVVVRLVIGAMMGMRLASVLVATTMRDKILNLVISVGTEIVSRNDMWFRILFAICNSIRQALLGAGLPACWPHLERTPSPALKYAFLSSQFEADYAALFAMIVVVKILDYAPLGSPPSVISCTGDPRGSYQFSDKVLGLIIGSLLLTDVGTLALRKAIRRKGVAVTTIDSWVLGTVTLAAAMCWSLVTVSGLSFFEDV